MRRTAIGVGLILAAWTAAAADGLREEALVRRIRWPVTIEERTPGGCDGLTASDVKVTEDGVEVRVDAIEKRRLRAVHAIVIDNSTSMRTRLDAAKRAAGAYLERLPPDEPAMLATFSDTLILNSPLTTDRETLLDALDRVQPRAFTALNDAIYYTVNHLATRPERKILVLLSDGCDSASMVEHSLKRVAQLASAVPGLTVFPIGINLPATCTRSMLTASRMDSPLIPLQTLALNSGGRMYQTRDSSGLESIFDDILTRVQSEGFLSYRPLYHGEGAKDVAGATRRRKVRIESLRPGRCRIKSAGPITRAEQDPRQSLSTAMTSDRIDYVDWWSEDGSDPIGRLHLLDDAMVGHGADVEREPSWLYSATAYHLNGRYRTSRDFDVRFLTRDYRVDVPPFEHLQASRADPLQMLLALLDADDRPFVAVPGAESPRDRAHRWLGEKWVHGQTLLEIRDTLARGLFTYEGYREFAYRKVREAYREEMSAVVALSSEVRALPAEERTRLDRLIAEHRPEPTDLQLQRYLAEWLGDIRAYDLVLRFETWAVNTMFESAEPAEIDSQWLRLGEWFPPPTQVRIISPLIPQYDPQRDAVGFWRIVLPEVEQSGPPLDRVPEHPLALTLLRELESSDLTMRDLSYIWDDAKTRRRILGRARKNGLIGQHAPWKTIPMVSFSLGPAGEDPTAVTVLWNPDSPTNPLCIDLERRNGATWVEELLALAPTCGR